MTTILSIQSSVAYGHVGNSAATFPLMRMGVEVWPILTVHFSNTTAYETCRGPVLSADDLREVLLGVTERGVLGEADAVLSGFQGDASIGAVTLEAVAAVKQANPAAIYCCDPVMGDVGRGFFVRPGIPEYLRDEVVPYADIITPNLFELSFLTGTEATTTGELLAACDTVRSRGPQVVLVTSAVLPDDSQDVVGMVLSTPEGAWRVETPHLNRTFGGSGDLTAATFLAQWLRLGDPAAALAETAAVVYAVLKATADSGKRELQLVAAQDELVTPRTRFDVTRLA
ncbi:pyridoxal kinase PdxY [Propionicicella superfundia]|uniref:pyridoxal kinase PdxY n=1 Tax=Propionicicella superfundia TaxID=348582 RepID=UPI000491ABC4|nr:pyridoxal kinase PdxY [Propionicicella superfundia]